MLSLDFPYSSSSSSSSFSSSSSVHRSVGMEVWLVRGKLDMQPMILKLGLGLALTGAEFLFTQLRPRRRHPRSSSSPGRRTGEDVQVCIHGDCCYSYSGCLLIHANV
ncbi:hypothetical protein DsansV1_C36g0231831 [Dioscorea sansibarensis]